MAVSVDRTETPGDTFPLSAAEQNSLDRALELIRGRKYFEAHEVLEDAWAPCRTGNRLFLQAVIHVAVGAYHATNGNYPGMQRQLQKALRKLRRFPQGHGGLDTRQLCEEIVSVLAEPCQSVALASGGILEVPVSRPRRASASSSSSGSVLP